MERQTAFKADLKMAPAIKGASTLDLAEFKDYDTKIVNDPCAKNSKKVARSNLNAADGHGGDGDVWKEKVLYGKTTGNPQTFFISKNTGAKSKGEPPSGASKVIYLRMSFRDEKLKQIPKPCQDERAPKQKAAFQNIKRTFMGAINSPQKDSRAGNDSNGNPTVVTPDRVGGDGGSGDRFATLTKCPYKRRLLDGIDESSTSSQPSKVAPSINNSGSGIEVIYNGSGQTHNTPKEREERPAPIRESCKRRILDHV